MINGAQALRNWLRGCPEIGRGAFGADYLGMEPGSWSLNALPGAVQYRENILGQRTPEDRQEREFQLDWRADYGAQAGQNLENLGVLQRVGEWILEQSAEGSLPEWEGGRVTAILPEQNGAAAETGSGEARYRLRLRVFIERDQ